VRGKEIPLTGRRMGQVSLKETSFERRSTPQCVYVFSRAKATTTATVVTVAVGVAVGVAGGGGGGGGAAAAANTASK